MRNLKIALILIQLAVVAVIVTSARASASGDCAERLGLRRQVAQWLLSVSTELRFEPRVCHQVRRAPVRAPSSREPSWAPASSRVQKFARVP